MLFLQWSLAGTMPGEYRKLKLSLDAADSDAGTQRTGVFRIQGTMWRVQENEERDRQKFYSVFIRIGAIKRQRHKPFELTLYATPFLSHTNILNWGTVEN